MKCINMQTDFILNQIVPFHQRYVSSPWNSIANMLRVLFIHWFQKSVQRFKHFVIYWDHHDLITHSSIDWPCKKGCTLRDMPERIYHVQTHHLWCQTLISSRNHTPKRLWCDGICFSKLHSWWAHQSIASIVYPWIQTRSIVRFVFCVFETSLKEQKSCWKNSKIKVESGGQIALLDFFERKMLRSLLRL